MAVNWENLPSTNTPLNATNLKGMLDWTQIASYQTASSSTTTSAISGLGDYNEFLVVLTPVGVPARFMNSMVVAKSNFLVNSDSTNGYHQISDNERSGGVSYMGSNQLKLYTGTYSGIVVYAR